MSENEYTPQDVIGLIGDRIKDSDVEWPPEIWDILRDVYVILGSRKVTLRHYIDVSAQLWDLNRATANEAVRGASEAWQTEAQAEYTAPKVLGHYVKKVESADPTFVRFMAVLRLRVAA